MADFPDRSHWQALAQQLSIPGQAFIEGRYTHAASGARFDCISPIDGRVLGVVADCDAQDVERAVGAARRAFDAGHWSQASPAHRKRVLLALAALVEKHADELALHLRDRQLADAGYGDHQQQHAAKAQPEPP